MNTLDAALQAALDTRAQQQLTRQRLCLEGPQQPGIRVAGRELLSFCSNDYLGLANHPEVVAAFQQGLVNYGAGSGASHLVTGHSEAHEALEQALADFTGRDRALLFGSGYMANLGVLTTLLGAEDRVLQDRLNHASLLDGGRFSGARFERYAHADVDDLARRLQRSRPAERAYRRQLIVTDGVFSMDGDVASLVPLCALAREHDAVVMIDDAHGFGCLGPRGDGLLGALRAEGQVLGQEDCHIVVGTLGKAFGTAGAFVAGSETLIETLVQFCRPYIYTTALPAAMAVATLRSLELVMEEDWRRQMLKRRVQAFRTEAQQLGFTLLPSTSPIQAIIMGTAERALQASALLAEQGLQVAAIRPPTVPAGTARLRLTFSAAHTDGEFGRLLDALRWLAGRLSP